jgi:hypothetical protein
VKTDDLKALECVETIEDMHAEGCSLASIRRRIVRDCVMDTPGLLAYVEGYLACLARRVIA